MRKKILLIFGTRPEAIKMAPVYEELNKYDDIFETRVCITGQHKEMLSQVLDFFDIMPDYNLNLMRLNQDLYNLSADIITGLKLILEEFQPDVVMVHGDTTTAMSSSIAAFYNGAIVCHIEAGLRTNNKLAPFPEEINRQLVSRIADIHFAPTIDAQNNLLKENISRKNIVVTGNTVIDALLYTVEKTRTTQYSSINELQSKIDKNKEVILVTGHRRENFGDGFLNICSALIEISKIKNVQIVYPVHLNPNVNKPVFEMLSKIDNITLLNPLKYEAFVWLMNRSKIILTDSGGVQEEAPSLGKPVLVMRDNTERPEAVRVGTVLLVGTNKDKIVSTIELLLTDKKKFNDMTQLHNPYGDGNSSKRIVDFLKNNLF